MVRARGASPQTRFPQVKSTSPRLGEPHVGEIGGKAVKLERLAVSLDEQELMELEAIVQDGDKEAALRFLRRLRQRIQQMQLKSVRP